MWHKVKELNESGLNKSQIVQQVGIQRKTVRKYLLMNEDEFHSWIKKRRNMPKKNPVMIHQVLLSTKRCMFNLYVESFG